MPPDLAATQAFSIEIVQTLKKSGFQALWAGGCVRDLLLGRESKDFDVATNATPDQVRDIFGHDHTIPIGASFGVITVNGGRRRGQVEVATFRTDMGYSDGRRPDAVRFSSAEEDAQRRDFTINGMFYDPIEEKVLDYVGGRRDLKHGLVRSIGNPYLRFEEDKLRMLRAVRFSSNFAFDLELATQRAIREFARHIHVVSAERIAAEMRRMLADNHRMIAVRMLRDLSLLDELLPELNSVVGHALRWSETYQSLEALQTPNFSAAMALLLRYACQHSVLNGQSHHPIEPAAQIAVRWKLTNEETKTIQWLLRHERQIRQADQVAWPTLQRLLIAEPAPLLIAVGKAIQLAKRESTSGIEYAQSRIELPEEDLNPPPLLNGGDLIQAGYKPGPQFQRVLEKVRDEQLERRLTTAAQALEFVKTHWNNI
ncbi:CCA tRNA nucleotidyltransferase [Bremerella cremea]|uniref:CCA tRNA nucleotidyltransferase n=1 Tax=Bremerella cremea TaxID=1031537 RepID=A0A368KS19_9BACT|nr:CCA tRNA nucleotidyltransferase [Bremerella cremea]RCS50552.1 CCA tRNA nucleotidyltransferase [Bremerella cremea]